MKLQLKYESKLFLIKIKKYRFKVSKIETSIMYRASFFSLHQIPFSHFWQKYSWSIESNYYLIHHLFNIQLRPSRNYWIYELYFKPIFITNLIEYIKIWFFCWIYLFIFTEEGFINKLSERITSNFFKEYYLVSFI